MFALESLAIAGETHENSAAVRRACDFLVSKQMDDGGWGETYMVRCLRLRLVKADKQSCVSMQYAQHERSQVVQTAWAVLALIYGEYPDPEIIKKACRLLMERQQADGRWEQEDTEGIFNKNCAIDYPGTSWSHCCLHQNLG
jgi:lanosterol synthase